MKIFPEKRLLFDKKPLAITAHGSAGCNDLMRMTSFLSQTGGFRHLLSSTVMAKNPAGIRKLEEATTKYYKAHRRLYKETSLIKYEHYGRPRSGCKDGGGAT